MKIAKILATATAISALLSGVARAEDVTISYWMWDGNQSPEYRKCADKFEAANPGIKIDVKQEGWDNYWTNLTTGFVAGTAPDVFVNHLSRFPEFLTNGVMVDLTDRIAADKTEMTGYIPGLAESWNKEGRQFGLPKDWDTVALVYNKKMVADAGVSEEEMMNLDWNPKDGGSFGKVLAKLSVDEAGKHGDQEGFDKSKVATYGMVSNRKGDYGQTEWSWLAVSNGFKYIDKPWGTKFSYDDPKLAETFDWIKGEVAVGPSCEPGRSRQDRWFVAFCRRQRRFVTGRLVDDPLVQGQFQVRHWLCAGAERPRWPPLHVQRSGRFHLVRLEEPGSGVEVGAIPGHF